MIGWKGTEGDMRGVGPEKALVVHLLADRLSRDNRNMRGVCRFYRADLELRGAHKRGGKGRVEYVVVQCSILDVHATSLGEFLERAGVRVSLEVVQAENFGQVGHVILADSACMIVQEMHQRGYRAAVIERAVSMRDNKEK